MTTDGPHDPDGSPTADGRPGVEIAERIASDAVTVQETVDLLGDLAASDPDAVGGALNDLATFAVGESSVEDRQSAVAAIAEFATERPAYAAEAASALGDILDDPVVGIAAFRALAHVADEKPAAVDSVSEAVGRRLTDGQLPARQCAVRILRTRADDDPTAVSHLSSRLVDAIVTTEGRNVGDSAVPDHEQRRLEEQTIGEERLGQRTAAVLEAVAAADPDAVAPELDRLGRVVDPATPRNPHLEERIVGIVRSVARASPGAAVGTVDSLVAVVESANAPTSLRARAAGTLATLADERFEAATEPTRTSIPALGDLLTDAEPVVRANAGSLLSYVAQRYPEAVASLTDTLVERLDDEQVPVRASVVWTLGLVDTDASREALREAAAVDPDPDVRALAAELLSSETIG